MITADALLERLEKVQPSSNGWRAVCPACGGKSRKLSVSTGHDGRILIRCFGGCCAAEIVQAVGLTLGDLFQYRLANDTPEERRRRIRFAREAQWGAALEVLSLESTIVLMACQQISGQHGLSQDDNARLQVACERITNVHAVLRDCSKWRPARQAA